MEVPTSEELPGLSVPLAGRIWRAVESQTYAVTRQLVTSREDQERLEELLEGSKPAYQAGTEHLDYLLKTPFRYQPPKKGGSRFRRPFAPYGVFYGAEHRRTALAELAYHRYRFLEASPGTEFPGGEATLTVFAVDYRTSQGIDLTLPPLVEQREYWVAPSDYSTTQTLGERANAAGIGAIRYESVRDPIRDAEGHSEGRNVSILDPAIFDPPHHHSAQTWHLYLGSEEANARRALAEDGEVLDYRRRRLMIGSTAKN
ncbi:RES domain-containing protein [Thiohalospira halophila DSM 15071]|uniref:RES domain-containing protein n=1 Tax=Thiohalospira halophila DSM 15071 TaxID=1123397 RepID=A0A1I1SHT6_9GAMM|nr:RES domain-containing protein [Thiohalospira halophila DSM 15071]